MNYEPKLSWETLWVDGWAVNVRVFKELGWNDLKAVMERHESKEKAMKAAWALTNNVKDDGDLEVIKDLTTEQVSKLFTEWEGKKVEY